MSEKNNTIKEVKNQYLHLTEKDRIKIQTSVNQKDSNGKRFYLIILILPII